MIERVLESQFCLQAGRFIIAYLWLGSLAGLPILAGRWSLRKTSPAWRYNYSLAVFALLMLLAVGILLTQAEAEDQSTRWPGTHSPRLAPALACVWGIAGGGLLLFTLLGVGGIQRIRRRAVVLSAEWQAHCEATLRRFRCGVPICESLRIDHPVALGILRPMIVIPSALLAGLTPQQLELILLHELAHIRRRDNLVILMQRLIEPLLGFHPLLWIVSGWLERDRELCCDQFVLNHSDDRHGYAEILAELATCSRVSPRPSLSAGMGKQHVLTRIRFILNQEETPVTTPRILLPAAALLLAFSFAWLSPGTGPASAQAETPEVSEAPAVQPAVPPTIAAPAEPTTLPPVLTRPLPLPPPVRQQRNLALGNGDVQVPAPGTPAEQAQMVKRAWGPEQAIGAPDTNEAGDIQTAWASLTQDDQREWLICHYAEETMPVAVLIHETFNPGAVYQVSFLDAEGKETVAWTGADPTPPTEAKGLSVIPVKTDVAIKKIKIYIDSPKVPGWNEIDAVGLRTADGEMLWASNVEASSTYASGIEPAQPMIIVTPQQLLELQELKNKVAELEKEVDRLKELEKKLDALNKRLDEEQQQ